MWAVAQMKEGKSVKREHQQEIYGYFKRGFLKMYEINNKSIVTNPLLDPSDFEATDWKIHEEEDNWNLGDEDFECKCLVGTKVCANKYIKIFIQKVKEDMADLISARDCQVTQLDFEKILTKRTGDLK